LKNKKQTRDKKKKRMGLGKKILLIVLFTIIACGSVLGYNVYKNGGGLKGFLATAMGHNQDTVKTLPKMYCLLLGQSETLTDTIIIAEYDPQEQQASILSIPRDTYVGTNKNTANGNHKINAAYAIGRSRKNFKRSK
jgi:anionic cell wall polymer biosynthesis LytR-Cps2A-Psr (LCP) family protein